MQAVYFSLAGLDKSELRIEHSGNKIGVFLAMRDSHVDTRYLPGLVLTELGLERYCQFFFKCPFFQDIVIGRKYRLTVLRLRLPRIYAWVAFGSTTK